MTVIGWYFAVPCAFVVIPSVPLYIVMLYSHYKYRNKVPFSSPFFKISFHLGIFDLLHLFNDWVIGMLPYLGLHNFIVEYQHIFAKQFTLVWWYTALGQKLGVLLLAIDRLTSMWFSFNFTKQQTYMLISLQYIIPVFLTAPQAFFDFGYMTFNHTNGLLLYWGQPNYQWIYFFCCIFYCGITSLVCAVSYGMTFYKVYQHQQQSSASQAKNARTEAKLAVAGFILFFMTFCCGIFCWSLVTFEMSFAVLLFMMGLLQIVFDSYCCINPYLILVCSKAAMSHFKAVIFRKPPESFETKIFTMSQASKPNQTTHSMAPSGKH